MRKSLFSFVILGALGCVCVASAPTIEQVSFAAPTIDAGCSGEVSCDIPAPQAPTSHKVVYEQSETVGPCPTDMVLVEGMYCQDVQQTCKRYLKEDIDKKGRPIAYARCAEFLPSKCIGGRVHKRFCIDKDEATV